MKAFRLPVLSIIFILTMIFDLNIYAQEIASVELGDAVTTQVQVCGVFKSDRSLWVYKPGEPENVEEIYISEEAKNFDQIEVGDMINITYYESVALSLNAPGELPEENDDLVMIRAAEGENPGGIVLQVYDISAIIQDYDEESGVATLMGPRGNILERVVSDEVWESGIIKVGQTVHLRYTQTLAISLEKL